MPVPTPPIVLPTTSMFEASRAAAAEAREIVDASVTSVIHTSSVNAGATAMSILPKVQHMSRSAKHAADIALQSSSAKLHGTGSKPQPGSDTSGQDRKVEEAHQA
jgi:hypothetical protein